MTMNLSPRVERRATIRQTCPGRAAVLLWLRPGTPPLLGELRVVDLSEKGVGLLVARELTVGDNVALKLGLVLVEGQVIHVGRQEAALWRVGCVFRDPLSRDLVEKCLANRLPAARATRRGR